VSSRVLRDDLWTSEPIGRLHDKTFRLYVCLINAADDYGLVDTGFGEISRAAPLARWAPEDIQKMLSEMYDAEILLPYRVQAKTYCAVDKWQCFMRSVKPKHPIPSFGLGHIRMPYGFKNQRVRQAASLLLNHLDIKGTPQGVPGDDLGHEGKKGVGSREEGKKGKRRRDGTGARSPKASVPIPADFALTTDLLAQCINRGLTKPEVERAFTRFTDNARAKGYEYKDWPAAFRTWCNFDVERKIKAGDDPNDPDAYLREGGYTLS
jgi:hypothetical protein